MVQSDKNKDSCCESDSSPSFNKVSYFIKNYTIKIFQDGSFLYLYK